MIEREELLNGHPAERDINMIPDPAHERYYIRFAYYHRFLHALVIISFLGLVLTGMPLKYSETGWARSMATYMGGIQTAGYIHRVCGVITFLYFILHLLYAAWYVIRVRREPLLGWFFGPNSMVPWIKDVKDVIGHFKWFFGLGERPQFDRFTYWEKFDYFAVFWGVGIIGISGLFLWFPVFFSKFLPGWAFNVAIILHSDEALLAAGFIFTIHFFNTHLRPEKFPLDHVIFTGRITEEELQHERPLEYMRLVESGQLEQLRATPPGRTSLIWSRIVGFTAYGVGLIMILFIIYAAYKEMQ
jgi:cytochrome b subunit of formate dehydrogenase